jgi:O-antigen ligase
VSLTALLFALFFFGLLGAALIRHPIYGLMAYLASFYVHPPSRWWGQGLLIDVRWAFLAAGITLVAVLIHRTGSSKRSFFSFPIVWLMLTLLLWAVIQLNWALWPEKHLDFVQLFAKFILAAFLIYRAVDSEKHLRWFLWAHFLGCLCLAIIAAGSYSGGRFDSFGGPGIADANSAANQLVTGILAGASLFLGGKIWGKVGVLGVMPFVLNALVMTVSRSGFLAFVAGGVMFNLFTPWWSRRFVKIVSVLGILLLGILAGPQYWERIGSIKAGGAQIEGVDTGAGRLDIISAQWKMFQRYPMGCGHRCTAVLSHEYLGAEHFTDLEEGAGRSSHNTFMTLLVEQGVLGAVFYFALVAWFLREIMALYRRTQDQRSFVALVLPAVAASAAAIFVADMFVDLLKHEVRIWMIAIIMSMHALVRRLPAEETTSTVSAPMANTGEEANRGHGAA